MHPKGVIMLARSLETVMLTLSRWTGRASLAGMTMVPPGLIEPPQRTPCAAAKPAWETSVSSDIKWPEKPSREPVLGHWSGQSPQATSLVQAEGREAIAEVKCTSGVQGLQHMGRDPGA